MKITHHHTTADELERLQRQTAIHRKCLLLIRGRHRQAPAYTRQKAG